MDIIDQLLLSHGYKKFKNYVYVLELKNNKYYVGKTNNFVQRILSHTSNKIEWTKIYKPIKILELIDDKKDLEKDKTLEYMKLYGWQNVRGYAWTKVNMKNPPKDLF